MINLIFAGTPDFSNELLLSLIKHDNFNILACLSQPAKPKGRGNKVTASSVTLTAQKHNIPIYTPESLKHQEQHIKKYNPDFLVVVAYGLIIPESILNIPKYACINVHTSILPRWRGAAPIQRAILNQDNITGVSIMQMTKGLDTGPVYTTETCPISITDTTSSLTDKLLQISSNLLPQTLTAIFNNQLQPQQQSTTGVTYAKKIDKAEALINWQQSAEQINCAIRAFNPSPGSFSFFEKQRIKIWQTTVTTTKSNLAPGTIVPNNSNKLLVATSSYDLSLDLIQFAGGNKLTATQILNNRNNILCPMKQFG